MPDAALAPTANALVARVLSDLPPDHARGRSAIARLPSPVAGLLAARLDRAVDDATPSSAWIDESDDRVRRATVSWAGIVRPAAQVPANLWAGEVRSAVESALEHLVRPASALAQAAFAGAPSESDALPIETVLAQSRQFVPYPYLPEIAARYVERKEIVALTSADFHQLLQRIDRRMVQTFGSAEWITLLAPLYDLAGPVSDPTDCLPGHLLCAFFEAKGADEIAAAIEPDASLSADDLRQRIAGLLSEDLPAGEEPLLADPDATDLPAEEHDDESPAGDAESSPEETEGDRDHSEEADREEADSEVEATGTDAPAGHEADAVPDAVEAPGDDGAASDDDQLASFFDASADDEDSGDRAPPAGEDDLADAAGASRESAVDAHPLLGSQYNAPEFDPVDDSDVIGPARPMGSHDADPELLDEDVPGREVPDEDTRDADTRDAEGAPSAMEVVRESVAAPAEDPEPPMPPVLDLTEDSTSLDGSAPTEDSSPEEPEGDLPETPAESSGDAGGVPEPIWARLLNPDAAPVAPPPAEDPPPGDVPLWKQFAQSDLASRLPPPDVDDIVAERVHVEPVAPTERERPSDEEAPASTTETRVLGPRAAERRSWFIEELFSGDSEAYRRTLLSLDAARTYTEATSVVSSEVLRRHGVSPYTEAAVTFIDSIQEQFDKR